MQILDQLTKLFLQNSKADFNLCAKTSLAIVTIEKLIFDKKKGTIVSKQYPSNTKFNRK